MVRSRVVFVGLVAASLAACGPKPKPVKAKKPVKEVKDETPTPPPETEADREAKRTIAAHAIIPEGSSCLPATLKDAGAPRLELGVVNDAPTICAFDQDSSRMLGPVGCFAVDLTTSALTYKEPHPLPGLGFAVAIQGGAARGYPVSETGTAHIVWSSDQKSTAILAGEKVHVFDAAAKTQSHEFAVNGDKGVTGSPAAIYWVGETIFVENGDGNVWAFKAADGTLLGGIEVLGGKPGQLVSVKGGSFSILNTKLVGLADAGWNTMTQYETDSGKRSKMVRKVAKAPCKAEDADAFYKTGTASDAKCQDFLTKNVGYLVGANGILGSKNLLIVLRGARLGELGVIDPKTLVEQKKLIKLPWCEAGAPKE